MKLMGLHLHNHTGKDLKELNSFRELILDFDLHNPLGKLDSLKRGCSFTNRILIL